MAQATHDIPNNPATPHKNFGFNMITAPTSPVQLRGNKKRALGRRREAADAEREAKRRRLAWGERLKSEYEDELEFLAEIVEKRLEAINKGDLKGFKVGLTLSNTGKGMRGSKTRQSIIIEMSNIWRYRGFFC